ncbi:MAG: PKD domain-containing protein [Pseudomonadota bacterium]
MMVSQRPTRPSGWRFGQVPLLSALSLGLLSACGGSSGSDPAPQNSAPTADFTIACTDLACAVDGSASSDSDGTIAGYSWDFGDNTTATGATANHSYANAGDFTVALTVTDDDGATASSSQTVTVTAPNVAPTAAFTSACTDLICDFDGSTSSDSDGTIASITWDFGDGNSATGTMVSHTYATAGDFTVIATVTDDDGAIATDSQQVTATAPNVPPMAVFTVTCSGLSCDVDGSGSTDSDGTVTAYAWDFGDTTTATGVTASHTYAAAGDFTIELTVTDDDGATNAVSQSVTVVAPELVQVGDTISGLMPGDQDGRVVDISDDGTRVVLGTQFADLGRINGGQVRVLEWDGNAWVPLGQLLANQDGVQASWGSVGAVSLSGDGQRLAIGNQLTVEANGKRGSIWIYEWIGGQWTQIGARIASPPGGSNTGIDGYGVALALSTDGSRLVAGARTSKATANGIEGAFSVFEFAGGAWSLVGNSVFGSQPGEQLGYAVDISGDGSRVVVGAPSYNEDNTAGVTLTPGRAFVYDYNGSVWVAVGNPVVGRLDGPADIRLGQSVNISDDGSRIATFGNFSGDRVRVFELSGGNWTQLGDFFELIVAFDFHQPMSLSADGDRIALGGPFSAGNNNGRVAVFDWDGSAWVAYAPQAEGDNQFDNLGWSVAMTPDGTRVIGGMPGWDDGNLSTDIRGGARVYDIR